MNNKSTKYKKIYSKHHGLCHLCDESVPYDLGTLDHIIPVSKGGTGVASNLALAHKKCNSQRNNRTVEEYRFLRSTGYQFSVKASTNKGSGRRAGRNCVSLFRTYNKCWDCGGIGEPQLRLFIPPSNSAYVTCGHCGSRTYKKINAKQRTVFIEWVNARHRDLDFRREVEKRLFKEFEDFRYAKEEDRIATPL